jgi:hypothetical protein
MTEKKELRQNLQSVEGQISAAARQAERKPDEIQLVVVTKKHPVETLQSLIEIGVKNLGESYAQEGQAKIESLRASGAELANVQWHMIGHVQSRKASTVVQHFDILHSLDSLKLASRINRIAKEQDRVLPVLLEVNISGEASKHGFPASEERAWPDFFPVVEEIAQLAHLRIKGLMSMAAIVADRAEARPYFERTRQLRDRLAERFGDHDWSQLSMGMSSDFEAAILEGATIVRVGSKILGPRPS